MAWISGLPGLLLGLHHLPPLAVVGAGGRDTTRGHRLHPSLHLPVPGAGRASAGAGDIPGPVLRLVSAPSLRSTVARHDGGGRGSLCPGGGEGGAGARADDVGGPAHVQTLLQQGVHLFGY